MNAFRECDFSLTEGKYSAALFAEEKTEIWYRFVCREDKGNIAPLYLQKRKRKYGTASFVEKTFMSCFS